MTEAQRAAVAKIDVRIAAIEHQRATLITEANRQIAFLDGKIAALRELITPAEPTIAPDPAIAEDQDASDDA